MEWVLTKCVLSVFLMSASVAHALEVTTLEDQETKETLYQVEVPNCAIAWRLKTFNEGGGFGLREFSRCVLSLNEQVPIREAILERIIADTHGMPGVRNFLWGRVKRGDANDAYAERFSNIVAKQPQWNTAKGTLTGKAAQRYDYLPSVINKNNIFSEVVALFESHGLTFVATDVEKLIVRKVDGKLVPDDFIVAFQVRNIVKAK